MKKRIKIEENRERDARIYNYKYNSYIKNK
jgi:hypothetical protein